MNASIKKKLIIVAGPNGAGKSTLSNKFLSDEAIVFDPDKESQLIREKNKGSGAETIYKSINDHFLNQIAQAIEFEKDFILETNFRDHEIMEIVEQFRDQGYSTNLLYFLLASEKESLHRVTSRVMKGGHFVDPYSIQLNYDEGLKNLLRFAPRFDRILLLDATGRIGEQEPLLNIEKTKIKFLNSPIPKWAESIIQPMIALFLSKDRSPGDDTPPTGLIR
ncbi:MAG: zeta toxin family protein [Bacteroidota bacterium]